VSTADRSPSGLYRQIHFFVKSAILGLASLCSPAESEEKIRDPLVSPSQVLEARTTYLSGRLREVPANISSMNGISRALPHSAKSTQTSGRYPLTLSGYFGTTHAE
jgi:hypothetical protein